MGASAPGSLKGSQKREKERGKGKKKEEKEGKVKKKEKDKSSGRHSAQQGRREGIQGRKLWGVGVGWGVVRAPFFNFAPGRQN